MKVCNFSKKGYIYLMPIPKMQCEYSFVLKLQSQYQTQLLIANLLTNL